MEFLSNYGLFLLKVATVVIGIVVVIAAAAAATGRHLVDAHHERRY